MTNKKKQIKENVSLVDLAMDNNVVDFKDEIFNRLDAKIQERISERKSELASRLFSKED